MKTKIIFRNALLILTACHRAEQIAGKELGIGADLAPEAGSSPEPQSSPE